MKNLFIKTACLSAALCLVACSKSGEYVQIARASFNVISSENFLPVSGGQISVTTDEAPTEAYAQDSWLKVSLSGNKITLSASNNEDVETRNTALVLKDAKGDSTLINIKQGGVHFGIPKDPKFITSNAALTRTLRVVTNAPTTYETSADWITTSLSGDQLTVSITANTTGRPRSGYVLTRTGRLTDTLKISQADLTDITGLYQQTSLMLEEGKMIPQESQVEIKRISDTKAQFIIDETLTWNVDFVPGKGLVMMNGQEVFKDIGENGKLEYYITVLAEDGFNYEHQNSIFGKKEPVLVNIAKDGSLVFAESERLSAGMHWASYAIARASASDISKGSNLGFAFTFIKPKLVRQD